MQGEGAPSRQSGSVALRAHQPGGRGQLLSSLHPTHIFQSTHKTKPHLRGREGYVWGGHLAYGLG